MNPAAALFGRASRPPSVAPRKSVVSAVTASAASVSALSGAAASAALSASELEDELAPFAAFLDDLQRMQASSAFREEQLFKFFTQLRHSSAQAQLQALDRLAALLERKPSLLLGCGNLLSLLLRILSGAGARSDRDVSELQTALYCKLCWLLASLAQEHLTVKDLKRLFRCMRRVAERRAPPLLCRLLLSSLADMASPDAGSGVQAMYVSPTADATLMFPRAPTASFDFAGGHTASALALPPLERWTATKSYSCAMWVRWCREDGAAAHSGPDRPSAPPQPQPQPQPLPQPVAARAPVAQPVSRSAPPRSAAGVPAASAAASAPAAVSAAPPLAYLYALLTDTARGVELLVGRSTGRVVVRACSKGVQHEVDTGVVLPDRQWCLLTVSHKAAPTFSRSHGTVFVHVNDECRCEAELAYPQLGAAEPLIFNAFAACVHPGRVGSPFVGRLAAISFHARMLTPEQVRLMYRRGPDLCLGALSHIERGRFEAFVTTAAQGVASFFGKIGSVAASVATSAGSAKSTDADDNDAPADSDTVGRRGVADSALLASLYRHVLLLLHPRCVEGHLALDCSPPAPASNSSSLPPHQPLHASVLPGVSVCAQRNVRELMHLAGAGLASIFPIFQHLDALSPLQAAEPSADAQPQAGQHKQRRASAASPLPGVAAEPVEPSRARSHSSLLPLVLRTLQLLLRDSPSNQLSMLSCGGWQIVAHLLVTHTAAYHLTEAVLAAAEDLLRELSWQPSMARLLAAQQDRADGGIAAVFGFGNASAANAASATPSLASASAFASAGSLSRAAQAKMESQPNHALAPARAAERTLYNDFFLHVLLNFRLWFRTPVLAADSMGTAAPGQQPSASAVQAAGGVGSASASASACRPPSASAVLECLSRGAVSFAVQLEVASLVKAHAARNPRYFRRLLSPGGGCGAAGAGATASGAQAARAAGAGMHAHAAGASVGPVRFVLDQLRRFVGYEAVLAQYGQASLALQPATGAGAGAGDAAAAAASAARAFAIHPFLAAELAAALRDRRTLRAEWLSILRVLLLCAPGGEAGAGSGPHAGPAPAALREADVNALVQHICEASEASAAAAAVAAPHGAGSGGAGHTQAPAHAVVAMPAHSWLLSELLGLLASLLLHRPEALPIVMQAGGPMLFVAVLARNVRFLHVQLAALQLLGVLLRLGEPAAGPPSGRSAGDMSGPPPAHPSQSQSQPQPASQPLAHAVFGGLWCLSSCYLVAPTYVALLELALGAPPASLGAEPDAARFAVHSFAQEAALQADGEHAGPTQQSSRGAEPSAQSSSSSSPVVSARLRTCRVLFPRCLELIHALCCNNDALRERERHEMRRRWRQEAARSPPPQAARARSPASPPRAPPRDTDNIHFEPHADAASNAPSVPPFALYWPTTCPWLGPGALPLLRPPPLQSAAGFLRDLDVLLSAGSNAARTLELWPLATKALMRHLEWSPQTPATCPDAELQALAAQALQLSPGASARASASPFDADQPLPMTPSTAEEMDIAAKLQQLDDGVGGSGDAAAFRLASARAQVPTSIHDFVLNSADAASPESAVRSSAHAMLGSGYEHATYLQQLSQQRLLADMEAEAEERLPPVSLLASRCLETLLVHALMRMKDGHEVWRDAMMWLRLEAEAQQQRQEQQAVEQAASGSASAAGPAVVSEETFRSVRRSLLVGLLHRIAQLPEDQTAVHASSANPYATAAPSSQQTLHTNLAHLVDLLEAILYYESPRFKQLTYRFVDSDGNDPAAGVAVRPGRGVESSTRPQASTSVGESSQWMLLDEDEGDWSQRESAAASRNSPSSVQQATLSPAAVGHPAFFRHEWALVSELLQTLLQLRFSLQSTRFAQSINNNLLAYSSGNEAFGLQADAASASPESLSLSSAISSITPMALGGQAATSGQLRAGGPLRIVIRMLLDCCSAVCFAPAGSELARANDAPTVPRTPQSAHPAVTQLQDVVSSLAALAHVELATSVYTGPAASGAKAAVDRNAASRDWKNRHVLHILWRLTQIMRGLDAAPASGSSGVGSGASSQPVSVSPSSALPVAAQMRRILQSTVEQIVESLKPFAVIPHAQLEQLGLASDSGGGDTSPTGASASLHVPLIVNAEGAIDIDPAFSLTPAHQRHRSASALQLPPGGPSGRMSPAPAADASGSGSLGPSSAAPSSSSSSSSLAYPRLLRLVNECLVRVVHGFFAMEQAYRSEFEADAERIERMLRLRLNEAAMLQAHSPRQTAVVESQRAASRSVQTFSYAEANRRAVADTSFGEHEQRVCAQWRELSLELYSEGSAWCPSDVSTRRKIYEVDRMENGFRMRRKLRLCPDAPDHHEASQTHIEHARTIAAAREREQKAKEQAIAKQAMQLPHTPGVAARHKPQPALLHTSLSSPSLSQTLPAAATAHTPGPGPASPSPSQSASHSHSLSPSHAHADVDDSKAALDSESGTRFAVGDAEQEQLSRLSQLGRSLGTSLRREAGDGEVGSPGTELEFAL